MSEAMISIKPRSKATRVHFNKDTINDFVLHPRHRDVRKSQLRKIGASLSKGESLEDPIIINLDTRTGKQTIIDGQHRYIQICDLISKHPKAQVSVHALQYTDLSLEEMNEVYTTHATQIKQSLADRLKMERDQNEILDKLLSSDFKVPINASSRSDAWNLPRLLRAYFNRYYPPERVTRSGIESFMYAVKLLDFNDYNRLEEFCVVHARVFGSPGSANIFCGSGAVGVLTKIYYHNVDKLGLEMGLIEARFKNLIGDPVFIQEGKSIDKLIMRRLYDYAIAKMNTHDRKKTIQQIPIGKI